MRSSQFTGIGRGILLAALAVCLALGAGARLQARAPQSRISTATLTAESDTDLNSYVLEVMRSYEGGRYPYSNSADYERYNGVTRNLYYQGRVLLKADPYGSRASNCVGITFEVFYRAVEARNQRLGLPADYFNDLTWRQLYDFALTWYAALGPKSASNCAAAIEKYGFGCRIRLLEQAKYGDFMDLTRTDGSGHTVIFFGWLRSGGRIIGLRYWSSQQSTRGIGYNAEYFCDNPRYVRRGELLRTPLYIGRVGPVREYRNY